MALSWTITEALSVSKGGCRGSATAERRPATDAVAMRLLLRAKVMFHGKGVRPVRLSSLRSALRNIRISGAPFTVTEPPRSTRRVWAVSRRSLRLCVIIFREGALQANVAVTIGCGAKHSMRIGRKALLILRFFHDSALSEALKPHGTYASSASYPVSTHGKPSISARLHFFCNKIANGC